MILVSSYSNTAAGDIPISIEQVQNSTTIKAQLNNALSTINSTLSSIPKILSQSFESNTISYILISGIIVGTITAIIKYVTEQYLPERRLKKARKNAIQKYSYPLYIAAYLAGRNVDYLLSHTEEKKFDDLNDNCYHLSILYSIGCFFGWYKILDKEAFLEQSEGGGKITNRSKKIQIFSSHSYMIFKGMSSTSYFHASFGTTKEEKRLEKYLYNIKYKLHEENLPPLKNVQLATIEPSVLTAIGELMIKDIEEPKQVFREVISFVEFTKRYENCNDFKKWFSYIEKIISGLSNSESDARWNRMVVFLCHLILFMQVVGKSNYMSKVDYLKLHLFYLSPKVHYFYIRYNLIRKITKALGLDKKDKKESKGPGESLTRKITKYLGLDKRHPTGYRTNWKYPDEIQLKRSYSSGEDYLESLHPVVLRRLYQDFINLGHSRKGIKSILDGQIYWYRQEQ